ncbi:hypothetical protein HYZ05_01145 [Candidatus Daviesbacteria bacterium]|nr:hypothetical protein [Candidatus Daviesbacteria bacterium]
MKQLIADEEFVSIQQAQARLTRIIKEAERKGKILRIMRNNESLGVLIPNKIFLKFVKLLETLSV